MFKSILLVATALGPMPLTPALAQDGADVTIVLGEEVDPMEPCMATRSNFGRIVLQLVSATLSTSDVKSGTGVPLRLDNMSEDQGNGTWRFHLRPGEKLSDGSAFDVNCAKASVKRAMSDKLTCETPGDFGDTKRSINVIDESTIDIAADPSQPILPLLVSMTTMIPAETPPEFVRVPVGTVPYKLAS